MQCWESWARPDSGEFPSLSFLVERPQKGYAMTVKVNDSRGEGKRFAMSARWLKLVIPLLLALALLPISAFAEELERQKEDPTENPPVIYLDKNDPRHKSHSREMVTPSDDPKIVAPLGQKRPRRGMSQYEWFKKEEEEKGPWHRRFLKSYDIPLEQKYIFELPQPDYAEIERLKRKMRSPGKKIGYITVGVKVDNPILNWKYLGEKDVDGKPKHVWITAIYAQEAKQIGFNRENVNLCRGCAIYVYGNVKYKGRPVAENLSDPYINFALTPGDTTYIEYHANTFSAAPRKGHPFTFSNYGFGFVPMFDYESLNSLESNKSLSKSEFSFTDALSSPVAAPVPRLA